MCAQAGCSAVTGMSRCPARARWLRAPAHYRAPGLCHSRAFLRPGLRDRRRAATRRQGRPIVRRRSVVRAGRRNGHGGDLGGGRLHVLGHRALHWPVLEPAVLGWPVLVGAGSFPEQARVARTLLALITVLPGPLASTVALSDLGGAGGLAQQREGDRSGGVEAAGQGGHITHRGPEESTQRGLGGDGGRVSSPGPSPSRWSASPSH